MNTRFKVSSFALLASTLLAFTPGCSLLSGTSTAEQKLDDVQRLSAAAASIGAQLAIQQNPTWRPMFEIAYQDLDQLVTTKTITGAGLRNIIASLPVKELKSDTARIVIEQATFLYDAVIGDKLNIEAQPYILAAATGVRDGLGAALGK